MIWIAQSEEDVATSTLEERLWEAADQFGATSGLKAQEHSGPILGITFLRFAEVRFAAKRAQLDSPSPLGGERTGVRGDVPTPRVPRCGSRVDEPAANHVEGSYEYFLGEFARTEGQKDGEFYTPSCIVRLLTEVIEPDHSGHLAFRQNDLA